MPRSRRNGRLSAASKNRRLAQLQRLMDRGEYFSDDAMRTRAPLLHHHYIAQVSCGLLVAPTRVLLSRSRRGTLHALTSARCIVHWVCSKPGELVV